MGPTYDVAFGILMSFIYDKSLLLKGQPSSLYNYLMTYIR
jgi:hypothetical protein